LTQREVIDTFGEIQQLELDFALRSSGSGFNPDVVRLPPSAADLLAFAPYNANHPDAPRNAVGEIDFIRDRYVNLASRRVTGTDVSLRWRLPESGWGRYTLRADVSHLDRFEQRRDSTAPAISSLSRNGLPRTRAAGGVFWQRLAWQAGLQANYISGFGDSSAPRETDGGLFPVGSWIGINLFVAYRLEHTALPETELRLGSNNLFDRAPPLADEDRGFDQLVHDARGRYLYAEIRCRW
jgi:hypothetical protein